MDTRRLFLLSTMLVPAFVCLTSQYAFAAPGGVYFVFDPADSVQTHTAGSQVRIVLAARDSSGNILTDWSTTGTSITLLLRNSTANTDSSLRSWNNDADGYSWARLYHNGMLLPPTSVDTWQIPPSAFSDGVLELIVVHTKAEHNVLFELVPIGAAPTRFSARMNFDAAEITNYLVSINSADSTASAVYVLRPYELTVAPRDRWQNVSMQEILSRFSARWPGDFGGGGSGTADLFTGAVFIKGTVTFLLTSRTERLPSEDLQKIIVFADANAQVCGESNAYEVRPHAPNPFSLTHPKHGEELRLMSPTHFDDFIWSRPVPPDPYTNVRISASDTTLHSDQLRYTWVIVDGMSLTRAIRYPSNNNGSEPRITLTHAQLTQIVWDISGSVLTKIYEFRWYVEADDGLYVTRSSPAPGHFLRIEVAGNGQHVAGSPSSIEFSLEQNFPNPFNPGTTIRFSIPHRERVTLKILNILGEEIKTIFDDVAAPGTHDLSFDATGLLPGVYVYALEAASARRSRLMVLAK